MRLTVFGACRAYPDAGQACSGYLLEHDGACAAAEDGYRGEAGVAAPGMVLDL